MARIPDEAIFACCPICCKSPLGRHMYMKVKDDGTIYCPREPHSTWEERNR